MNADHWRFPLSSADRGRRSARSVAGMETSLRNAALWGADAVLLVPAVVDATTSYRDAWTRSQRVIRERLLPLARELKVVIAVEEVWNKFLLSPLEFARYVDEFDSPWLKAYFDVGNVVFYGFPQDWIRTLGARIVKVHLKDFQLDRAERPLRLEKPRRRRHRLARGPAGAGRHRLSAAIVTTEVAAGDARLPEGPGRERRSVRWRVRRPSVSRRQSADTLAILSAECNRLGCVQWDKEEIVRRHVSRGLLTAACVALTGASMTVPARGADSLRQHRRRRQGCARGARTRRHGHDRQSRHQPHARDHDGREGNYSLGNVLPGPYDVKVSLQGFREAVRSNVPVIDRADRRVST